MLGVFPLNLELLDIQLHFPSVFPTVLSTLQVHFKRIIAIQGVDTHLLIGGFLPFSTVYI